MHNLTLVANLGLVLFLFLVGLEVDLRFLMSNWKVALSVGAAGTALPFGLGCAIAWGLYSEFRNEPGTVPIGFGVYMLFIGVAMAITVCDTSLTAWLHTTNVPRLFRYCAPHTDGAQTSKHACWHHCPVCGCWQRCGWLDLTCPLCRACECR